MELLERFASGDAEAFETLFRQFQGEVYKWILWVVRERAAAEDLTVETFWRLYLAHARFDPAGNFPAWLRRIATNVAIDHLKRRRPMAPLPEPLAADPEPDPVVTAEIRRAVAEALQKLPAKLQAAALLALVEERPYAEIAEALGISQQAVKSRVFRATHLLRRRLERQGIKP
jgi:RNA polymerase sigma-70 factor (ECF subfamily)